MSITFSGPGVDPSALNPGASSPAKRWWQRTIFEVSSSCSRLQNILFLTMWAPCALSTIVFSAIYAYAQANTGHFSEGAWQNCFLSGQTVTFLSLPMGDFASAASYQGLQTVIFSTLAFAIMARAYQHYEWLPSSVAFCGFACISTLSYYTSSPVLPAPFKLNPTLISLTKYLSRDDRKRQTPLSLPPPFFFLRMLTPPRAVSLAKCLARSRRSAMQRRQRRQRARAPS